MRLVSAAFALALSAYGWSQSSFTKAQVLFFRDGDGNAYNPPRQMAMGDKAEVARLLTYLKALGAKKGALAPGGWDAWGTITLMGAGKRGLKVFFPARANVYSQLGKHGDFAASAGFKDYLLELEKRSK